MRYRAGIEFGGARVWLKEYLVPIAIYQAMVLLLCDAKRIVDVQLFPSYFHQLL
jgi:hypothetical protein